MRRTVRFIFRRKFLSGWFFSSLFALSIGFSLIEKGRVTSQEVAVTIFVSIGYGLLGAPVVAFFLLVAERMKSGATNAYPGLENFLKDSVHVPPVEGQVEVPSHSEQGKTYLVDLKLQTCTCPDFYKVRRMRELGSHLRMCKHLTEAFEKANDTPDGKLLSAMLNHLREERIVGREYFAIRPRGLDLIVIVDPERSKWLKFIARSAEKKRRKKNADPGQLNYGLHLWCVTERRWGNKLVPENRIDCERIADELSGGV